MPRLAMPRTNDNVFWQAAAARVPSPPATIKVVIAAGGFALRATISTPDELFTGPGLIAIVLMSGGPPEKRIAISKAEIGPAASSNWKSGKISTPIMAALCP
jgi:hypothetical protein